jgi:micrococcal nuclease
LVLISAVCLGACQVRDGAAGGRVEADLALSSNASGDDENRAGSGPPAWPRGPTGETAHCVVTRIIDGDTIECRNVGRVRLIGMDTPELSQQPYGGQAKEALRVMLVGRAEVALELDVERRDSYDRLLAYVWVDSLMANWALVRQGWAVVLTYPPNVRYVDWFYAAQLESREEGAGLWNSGGFDCLPRDRRRGRC